MEIFKVDQQKYAGRLRILKQIKYKNLSLKITAPQEFIDENCILRGDLFFTQSYVVGQSIIVMQESLQFGLRGHNWLFNNIQRLKLAVVLTQTK